MTEVHRLGTENLDYIVDFLNNNETTNKENVFADSFEKNVAGNNIKDMPIILNNNINLSDLNEA